LFRRSKSETPATTDSAATRIGGKGRPTPSRKEAEAAARARARTPRTRREQMAAQRSARGESSKNIRAAMKSGDERFLPARDKGPVRRFVRDFVDSRFSFIELMLPLLVVTLVLGYSGSSYLAGVGNMILLGTMLLVLVDLLFMRMRLRRELSRRFPGDPLTGTTYYAVMRSLQMKFMRLPKAQVKIGQKLPDTYR
jgi:hypothetical protein